MGQTDLVQLRASRAARIAAVQAELAEDQALLTVLDTAIAATAPAPSTPPAAPGAGGTDPSTPSAPPATDGTTPATPPADPGTSPPSIDNGAPAAGGSDLGETPDTPPVVADPVPDPGKTPDQGTTAPPPVENPPIVPPPPAVDIPKVGIHGIRSYFNHAQIDITPFPGAACYLAVEWDETTQTYGHEGKSSGDAQVHAPRNIAYSPDPWHILLPPEELLPGLQINGLPAGGKTYKIIALNGKVPFSGNIMAGLMDAMMPDADNCPSVEFGKPLCDDLVRNCANAHGMPGFPVPIVIGISDPILVQPDRSPSVGTVLFEETFETPLTLTPVATKEGVTPDAPGDVAWFDAPTFDWFAVRCQRDKVLANPPARMHNHGHFPLYDSGWVEALGGGQGASSAIFRPKTDFDLSRRTRFSYHSNCHFLDGRFSYEIFLPQGDVLLHNDIFRTDNAGNRPCPGSGGQAIGIVYTNAAITVYVWDKGVLVDTFDPVFGKANSRWHTDRYAAWRCFPSVGNPSDPGYKEGLNDHNCGNDYTHFFEVQLTVFGPDTLVEIFEEGLLRVSYLAPILFSKSVSWYLAQVLYHSEKETKLVGTGKVDPVTGLYGRGWYTTDATGKLTLTAYVEEQWGIRCQRGVNLWHLLHPKVEQYTLTA